MARHKPLYMLVVIGTAVIFFITMVIMVWATSEYDISKEWFGRKGRRSDEGAYIDVRYGPPKWLMQMMLICIYLYHIAWLSYGLSTLCRRTPQGNGYLYYKPHYMRVSMYSAFMMSMLFKLTWAALLSSCGPVCVAMTVGSALTSITAFAISLMSLNLHGADLCRMGLSIDVKLVRALVHNGLAFHATWEVSAMFVELGGVMTADGYTQKDAFATMIGLSGFVLLAYTVADLLFIDRFTRYTVTPYIAYSLSYIGLVDTHWYSDRVSALSMVMLGLSLFALTFKVIVIIARRRTDPEPIPIDTNQFATALNNANLNQQSYRNVMMMPENSNEQSYRNVMMMPARQSQRVWMPNYNISNQMAYM